ncbi:MAG: hypothetical protein U0W24_21190 [Bacteroidales bacterium]
MKNLIFALFICFLSFSNLHAQEEIITKIRKVYNEYNSKLEADKASGMEFLPNRYEIKNIQNRPGLGPVNVNINYFFDETTTGNFADENTETTSTLRKVVTIQSAPSFNDYTEFFYSENGQLLFCYSKLTGYFCGEKRFYFDKGKMIKIKFNALDVAGCEDKQNEFTRTTGSYTKEDLNWEKWVIKIAQNHSVAFKNLFESGK